MKKLFLLILVFPLVTFAKAPKKDITLEYNVTEMICVTDAANSACPEDYLAVTLATDNASKAVNLDIQVSANGSTDSRYLKNEGINKSKRIVLSYDLDLKRLIYTRSSEIWETNPDYIIDTVSESIQFYQITNDQAVLVISYIVVKSDGAVLTASMTSKLTKK